MPQLEYRPKKILISIIVTRLQNAMQNYNSLVMDTVENPKRDLNYFAELGNHQLEVFRNVQAITVCFIKSQGIKISRLLNTHWQ